jgi:branched-chain amino acid transport system ATP-binding protein
VSEPLRIGESARAQGAELVIEDVSLDFSGFVVLSGVNVRVPAGRVVGIIGPNGSGKTSLLNCISGVYKPQHGRITLDGRDLTALSPQRVTAAGVARTFQHIEIPRNLTVIETALLGRHGMMRRYGVIGYGLGLAVLGGFERRHRQAAYGVLEGLDLLDVANTRIGDLPYGIAKRVDIARALAGTPSLLLLDEPAAGLTTEERTSLAATIRSISESTSITICVIEHDMAFLAHIVSHMVVMAGGEMLYEGSTHDVFNNSEIAQVVFGRSVEMVKALEIG